LKAVGAEEYGYIRNGHVFFPELIKGNTHSNPAALTKTSGIFKIPEVYSPAMLQSSLC